MEWIAIGSAVAAWVAALAAYRSSRVSRKAYTLALQQEARLRPSLSLHLVEGHVRRLGAGAPRLYVFRIVVSNRSDAPNSIREARLFIEHGRGHGPLSNLATPHNAELAAGLTGTTGEALSLPCAIAARTSLGGVVLFEVPSELLRDSRVEAYALQVVDTYGHETSVEAIFLEERTQ